MGDQTPTRQPAKWFYDHKAFQKVSEAYGIQWRYNIRAHRTECLIHRNDGIHPTDRWIEAHQRIQYAVRDYAQTKFYAPSDKNLRRWKPTNVDWEAMLNTELHGKETDPFIDWLQQLPAWDGNDRVAGLITAIWPDAPDDELTRWASTFMLVGAIQRAHDPGCKIDEFPVLIGPQGCGKSAFARNLLPDWAHEWHGDALNLHGGTKEQSEALAGKVIVEIPEMAGYRYKEIEHLKAFITRVNDGQHRGAYKRAPETHLRRCIFIGTSNTDQPLPNDASGNRRFVVIHVGRPVEAIEDFLDTPNLREQLWAEALHKHNNNTWPTARLPRHLHTIRDQRNDDARSNNEAIETLIDTTLAPNEHGHTLQEVCRIIKLTHPDGNEVPNKAMQMAVAEAMTALGWGKRKIMRNGNRQWRWFKECPNPQT